MTTPSDLLTRALKAVGAVGTGQPATPEDLNDALALCNAMLGQWQRKRWLVWDLKDILVISTGNQVYTVGPGGDLSTPRPDKIDAAYFRQVGVTPAVDYPLTLIGAREGYDQIALKSLSTWPQYAYYDPDFPVGKLYVWPIPPAGQFEIHINVKAAIGTFGALNQTIVLPPEYEEAIWANLALRLAPSYGLRVPPEIAGLAAASLATIRAANAQIPQMSVDPVLLGTAGGRYSIFGDTFR